MLGEARAIICPVRLFATKSMQSAVVFLSGRTDYAPPSFHGIFLRLSATFDTRQRIFDLMVLRL